MTIITKPLTEKKADKLIVPLVENDQNANSGSGGDVESQTTTADIRMVIFPTRVRRVSTTTTLCLLLTALIVVGIGIVGGTYLYQQYLRSQLRFKGWCTIPYNPDDVKSAMLINPQLDDNLQSDEDLLRESNNFIDRVNSYIQEELELDLETQSYEKIDVPDFHNGRSGRFIHDFNTNTTGIVDVTGKRCFIMPLNRGLVLPPRSLFDLVHKMWDGYYKVNTEIIRETMRVIIPPLTENDLKDVGSYISHECDGWPVYKLQKVDGVVKRSIESGDKLKFTQFAGIRIVEFDIVNLNDAQAFEAGNQVA